MTPHEHYRAGKLDQAVVALGEELRSNPLDPQRRTFLFELLCFGGQYDRAEKQLDILANQASSPAIAGLLAYRSALHAQRTREAMFLSGDLPGRGVAGSAETAGPGSCNGKQFESFADADPRLGDHLELFLAGSYTWVPLRFVQELRVEPPANLRDLLWARARLTLVPGAPFQEVGEVFLPVLTPLAHRGADDAVRLGRATVWTDLADGGEAPEGQKIFQVDDDELPALELRSVSWESIARGEG